MHDVTNQRLAAHQYYERRKYVFGAGTSIDGLGLSVDTKQHGADAYYGRRKLHEYWGTHPGAKLTRYVHERPLPDAWKSDSSRIAATPTEQVSIHQQLFDAMHPPYKNREFWNGPTPQPVKKGYSFPSTDEFISRAKQRIAREDAEAKAIADAVLTQDQVCIQAVMLKAWLRGHALQKESKLHRLLRTQVQQPIHFSRHRKVWETARKRKAQSDIDTVRLAWWLNAYQHRRHSTFSCVMRWSVINRLQPSSPAKVDVFSQCKNLMQNTWRAMNRADDGTLKHTIAQMTKGILLPETHVTNRDPAMAKPLE
jgi:hypothetical protein